MKIEPQVNVKDIDHLGITIKAAQELTKLLLPEQFSKSDLYEKYSFCAVCSEYALIKQRWIIDPLFFASRVFLKNTKRIMALAMIMTLALMVYSLGNFN